MFGCPQRIGLENRFLWIVCGLNKIHLTLWKCSVPRYEFLITFSSRRKWLILGLGQVICKMDFNILCLKVRKWSNTHTHTQLFASLLNEFEQELLALKLPFYKLMVFFFNNSVKIGIHWKQRKVKYILKYTYK